MESKILDILTFLAFFYLIITHVIHLKTIRNLKEQSRTNSAIIAKSMVRIVSQGIDIELLKDQLKIKPDGHKHINTSNN